MCAEPVLDILFRPISDNVNAKAATMNSTHLPKTGKNEHKKYYGVQIISGDSERVRGWDLMTHGGFVTYPHHDASGLCTYVTVRSGTKIWAYIDTESNVSTGKAALYSEWDALFRKSSGTEVPPEVPMGTLLLSRGDTLYALCCILGPRATHTSVEQDPAPRHDPYGVYTTGWVDLWRPLFIVLHVTPDRAGHRL